MSNDNSKELSMSVSLFKKLQNFIKLSVGLGVLAMNLHVLLLICGIPEPWTEWVFGYSVAGFIMLFIASYVLRLCKMFRFMLSYEFLVGQCIMIQREFQLFGTGDTLLWSRIIVLCLGTLCMIFYFKRVIL